MTNDELVQLYWETFPDNQTAAEVSAGLKTLKSEHLEALRTMYCNILLYGISDGMTKYDEKAVFEKDTLVQFFCENVRLLPKERTYYWAVYYFYTGKHDECLACLKKDMELLVSGDPDAEFDEYSIIDSYWVPFKKGFEGFWASIKQMISKVRHIKGLPEFCNFICDYYETASDSEAISLCDAFLLKYPEFVSPKEIIGYSYYSMKMWNNAIAAFEDIEQPMFFPEKDILWMLAWSFSKVRDYKNEEKSYRKIKENWPDTLYLNNNLAYCLFKQKKYKEAKEILGNCVKDNQDMPYAANNFIRVLIALGRNKDAKDFVKQTTVKIPKALIDKVKSLEPSNKRISNGIIDEVSGNEAEEVADQFIDLGFKREQFSSEKLLEDELTARIESGIPVFDMKLRIYRRTGEYGRQYKLPNGKRLDLLCEDDSGNLYVIELKKDSGYDDAYSQTADYLDWFEKSKKFGHKSISGIICLNNPSQKLIEDVKADHRMSLYEYQISYTKR